MDIDGFIATHQEDWDRLGELVRRAERDVRRLPADDVEELAARYQRASTHLSIARTRIGDPALALELSRLVARAAAVLHGTRPRTWRSVLRFVTDTFPAALWYSRAFLVWSALLFLVPAVAVAAWLAASPAVLQAAAPPAVREAYVAEDFEAYYSAAPSTQFATEVTVNNIQVGMLAFAGGALAAVPTVAVMVFNGLNVGVAAGLFAAAGEMAKFWGLITPHGLLELTAVFIAGGAGLRIGWTLVDPGDRRRATALREEGRRAITILVGLVVVFGIAGLIEGYVTGRPWPTWLRVGIGVTAEGLFLLYVTTCGRRAARRGLTGALGEQADTGWAAAPTPPAQSRPAALTSR